MKAVECVEPVAEMVRAEDTREAEDSTNRDVKISSKSQQDKVEEPLENKNGEDRIMKQLKVIETKLTTKTKM